MSDRLTETVQGNLSGDYVEDAPCSVRQRSKRKGAGERRSSGSVGMWFRRGFGEIEEGATPAESRVLFRTGQERLTGGLLYGAAFDLPPNRQAVDFGNYEPEIAGTEQRIRRRTRLVPFEVQILDRRVDPMLPSKNSLPAGKIRGSWNPAIKGFKQMGKVTEGLSSRALEQQLTSIAIPKTNWEIPSENRVSSTQRKRFRMRTGTGRTSIGRNFLQKGAHTK